MKLPVGSDIELLLGRHRLEHSGASRNRANERKFYYQLEIEREIPIILKVILDVDDNGVSPIRLEKVIGDDSNLFSVEKHPSPRHRPHRPFGITRTCRLVQGT